MSTISATLRFALSVLETFTEVEMPASKNRTITDDQFGSTVKLDAASTPAATKAWAAKLTGSQTIDLTNLARSVGPTVNATGLKLQMLLLQNLSTAGSLDVAVGATNGYAINGSGGHVIVPLGGSCQQYFADALADVDSTHKTLDVVVTGDFQIQMVFG